MEKSQEIQRIAANCFAYAGYHSTSMREIARKLGMNQSSLYHYFESKEGILFKLMNDAMDNALATMEEICATDIKPHNKLKRILSFYTRYYAGDQDRLTLLVNEQNSLDSDHRRILVDKERRYVKLFREVFEELGGHQMTKEIPHGIAIFAFLGMVHYTIKWYHRDGAVGLDALADIFVEIFTKGVLK